MPYTRYSDPQILVEFQRYDVGFRNGKGIDRKEKRGKGRGGMERNTPVPMIMNSSKNPGPNAAPVLTLYSWLAAVRR